MPPASEAGGDLVAGSADLQFVGRVDAVCALQDQPLVRTLEQLWFRPTRRLAPRGQQAEVDLLARAVTRGEREWKLSPSPANCYTALYRP